MSNLSEVEKLILEFSSEEEKETFVSRKTVELLAKFDKLYNSVKATIADRDEEYATAFELLMKETDRQIKSYLVSVKKDAQKEISRLNDVLDGMANTLTKSESSLKGQIGEAKKELKDFSSKTSDILDKAREDFKSDIRSMTSESSAASKRSVQDIKSRLEELSKDIEKSRQEFNLRIAGLGGGSMNRQILVGGVNPLTRYTDYNIIAGAGITITTANDDANRRVNLTITSNGGGGGISYETPVGTVDDSNVTFTVSHTPLYIVVNGAQYLAGTGTFTSYLAGTITLSSGVGTGGFIRSAYST